MICIHHNDADGHGAAAIVNLMIAHDMEPKTFIEYRHGKAIELDEESIDEKERVFIVDLALDENVMEVIRKCLKKECAIVHIDHHIGGKTFEENLSEKDKILYERVTNFYNKDISGCMLTFVYSSMTENEQKNPMNVPYDFTEDYSHFAFYPEENARMREYFIPNAVRFIDDNDVWRHQFNESKYFQLAYQLEDNDPLNVKFWSQMLYENDFKKIAEMVEIGESVAKYQDKIYKQANHNGFEVEIDGFVGWAVNCPIGNSFLFENKYKTYDFVCKFAYDGSIDKWRYSFYSKEKSNFNCAEVCRKYFNGGGHEHAAGGTLGHIYFYKEIGA